MESKGERQVAPTLDGIRRDHLARYEFAARQIKPGSVVIDCACGIGYGSRIIADSGSVVVAIDASSEAIEYGKAHYDHEFIQWTVGALPDVKIPAGEVAVCFETIEHIDDPLPALKAFHVAAPILIASVPNEDRFKYRRQKFHKRHYTRQEFLELLEAAGWRVTGWYGQADIYSEVVPDLNGRTAIVTAERAREGLASVPVPVQTAPHHVAIVGLGPSCASFFELTRRMGGISAYCDEVWGINAMGDVLRCDRVFHMDDLKVQEARAKLRPGSNIDAMVKWLKTHPGPVYTSRVRPGYPGLVEFPIEDVLNAKLDTNGGVPYFNSTTAYAVAYAIYIGVKHISLWGIDYTLPNAHSAESGRACVEFWLGIAAARGIEISVPAESSLLDACANERDLLYGYDCVDWRIVQDGGGIRLEFTELEGEVDAEEIERRYDHKKHPNKLMQKASE